MKTETDKIVDEWIKDIHEEDYICFWCIKELKQKLNELNKDTILSDEN